MFKKIFLQSKLVSTATVLLAAMFLVGPLFAQDATMEKRVNRLEKEMRAVQRTVFPGGNPLYFREEAVPQSEPSAAIVDSATPVVNLTARVDALESQLRVLTGQSEQNAFAMREMAKRFASFKASVDKRLAEIAEREARREAKLSENPTFESDEISPSVAEGKPTATQIKADTSANVSAKRQALVKAVEVPNTSDKAKDGYVYGYRLWNASLYREAQEQLKMVVQQWPAHRYASFAQNLLGRAYLDDGQPNLAAIAFYNNYKDRPNGERAPHSLMYMGVALEKLGRKTDACKAFRELEEVYGARAPEEVTAKAKLTKAKANC